MDTSNQPKKTRIVNVEVDEELWLAFKEATQNKNKSVMTVLRELMRRYVDGGN